LSGITPPVLVVHGALDQAVPVTHAELAKSKIAGSELLVLPGEGHLVLLGRSADAAKAGIVSFLNKHLKLAEKSHAE
jgi:pimeloyl-ACP methyl ester carboxylesterase